MVTIHAISAIDLMLQDIINCTVPFGEKLLLFGGDFRQILPVVPRANASGILESCINRHACWSLFKMLNLSQNIRADPEELIFKDWQIDIPNECDITSNIVNSIYPNFDIDRTSHIIVTSLNEDADKINKQVLQFISSIGRVLKQ